MVKFPEKLNKTTEICWSVLNSKVLFIVLLILGVSNYGSKSNEQFGWTDIKAKQGEPIISDGAGYYAYLPQWFIYGDQNFEFLAKIRETYPSSRFTDNVYADGQLKYYNKYYTGTAVSMIPFFAVAHVYAGKAGYEQDGYSEPYRLMANLASIFYFFFGCIGTYLFLRRFRIDRLWIVGVLAGIGFGTDISYFTNILNPFSHVFSFGVVAWMLFFAKKWADAHSWKTFLLLCLFVGWAIIIRPTNMLTLVFVPFLFPSTREFLGRLGLLFTKKWMHLLGGSIILGLFFFIQLYNVYQQTGEWSLNTYSGESFDNILEPKIWDVLFSYSKGLFVFAPVLFLMIPGSVVLYRKDRRLFWGFLLFFAIFTYITASWWCWWYGGGLGMRPYIDVMTILFVPVAFLLQYVKIWGKLLVSGFLILTIWMYQVYELQMRFNILHYDRMTSEQFWGVFMKVDRRFNWGMHFVYEQIPATRKTQVIPCTMIMSGEPMPANTFFKLDLTNPNDNPFTTIVSDSTKQDAYFGARIQSLLYLYSGDGNPTYAVYYFKDGKVMRESHFVVGPLIKEPFELSEVKLDIYPGLYYRDFDSLRIHLDEGYGFTGVKNLKVTELICR